MATMVLPGDEISARWLATANKSNKQLKTVGPGLKVHSDHTLVSMVAGILHETDNKIWVESAETRYFPRSGDFVLGTVTGQATEYFRVDIGGPQQAMLGALSFEGATKRNKPNVKTGSLIYGQVMLASKNIEPELKCMDNDGRAHGMGLIKTNGIVIQLPLNFARNLLKPENSLVAELGKRLKFELIVGMNGHIFIGGSPQTVVLVQKALLQSINGQDPFKDL